MDPLQYPIGPYVRPDVVSDAARRSAVTDIAVLPGAFAEALARLDDRQLDTPYRPGGWTLRRLAHHVPDSHLNAYVRFKLGLTEDTPTIKPYEQTRWAELPDSAGPIAGSLALLAALHERWVRLMSSLDDAAWAREIDHPEIGGMRLDQLVVHYAWHGRHHTAHVAGLRQRMSW